MWDTCENHIHHSAQTLIAQLYGVYCSEDSMFLLCSVEHSVERTHRVTVVALLRRHYNIITTGTARKLH